ncbi:MAG: hypothetical protein RLZZ338_3212, partial [Cyanobacteriota bacterium]
VLGFEATTGGWPLLNHPLIVQRRMIRDRVSVMSFLSQRALRETPCLRVKKPGFS